ncbi:DegT/DnrJ/EryC1/StrS family aminotransferase [Bacteriovoracaceae bacterium]|nr:DegT/DnrJ/EryC1/StrS family aminotransferase [Bacteriovoracaceae bacterium]
MNTKYPLSLTSWGDEEINAIQSVIKKDSYSMGELVQKFESEFATWSGCKYAVMVNSGSSANLLAVAALFYTQNNPLKPGDEVIVPAVSWSTTYYPLLQYGLKLKFVDIDIDTLNFNLQALESAITENTRMIFAVNLLGNPNDFTIIKNFIKDKNIDLIEDNCESLGAILNGKKAGTFGTMGTYSCFFSHHISTMEGGLITTDSEELYHILLSTRSHGWTRHLPKNNLVSGTKSDNHFHESFKFVLPGYNLRPLEMSGAIGSEQLKKLDQFISVRRKNANLFQNHFIDHPHLQMQKEIGESSWFSFALMIKDDSLKSRDELIEYLSKNGVETRPIVAGNFVKNPVIKYFDYEVHDSTANADYLDQHGFYIGNHHIDLSENIEYFKSLIDLFFK